jgi:hypothetical protein
MTIMYHTFLKARIKDFGSFHYQEMKNVEEVKYV